MIMIHDGGNGGGLCGQQPRTDDWFNQTVTSDKLLANQSAVSHRQSLPSVNYYSKAYTEQRHTITVLQQILHRAMAHHHRATAKPTQNKGTPSPCYSKAYTEQGHTITANSTGQDC